LRNLRASHTWVAPHWIQEEYKRTRKEREAETERERERERGKEGHPWETR
jgi:hypothetical protein